MPRRINPYIRKASGNRPRSGGAPSAIPLPRPPDVQGAKTTRANDPGIRPSSGARKIPRPLPDGRRVGEHVPELMALVQRAMSGGWREELSKCWPELVGPKFASHLSPDRFDSQTGLLLVVADHPIFQFEAVRELTRLAEHIRAKCPSSPVRRVRFMNREPQACAPGDLRPRKVSKEILPNDRTR